ncbi:carotenoid oxygenase [Ramaria rubella]|nr:carotenoid oxygenase [Ramaria rubella]
MKTHPYLAGNFSPIHTEKDLTPCQFVGSIPKELWGGQYVRNGGNPAHSTALGRDYHWFDGDGMLTGVLFKRIRSQVEPCFVNKFLLTDVYLSGRRSGALFLSSPLLPSISTLVSPTVSLHVLLKAIFRALFLFIKNSGIRLSVANTNILFHDQRALATCESGPPLEVTLPELDTVDWWTFGNRISGHTKERRGLGGERGLKAFFEEWTTGHPRVDPITSELILFGSSFLPPYVRYTVISSSGTALPSLLGAPVPIRSPKMMHDFGVSLQHTVILDLPLTLDPLNIARGKPIVEFYPEGRSRFGVFPRYHPGLVKWFESSACAIFHTANTWSDETAVNLLACRFASAKLVYIAGDISLPPSCIDSEDVCQLYYYRFPLSPHDATPSISHEFALSAIPYEFPSISHSVSMQDAQYVYGCTMRSGSFDAALGAAKIDCLVRVDVRTLIRRGIDSGICHGGVVDSRQVVEILASTDEVDPIKIFEMPQGWYAQECSFVSKQEAKSEADGYLLAYVFDESQLNDDGSAPNCARSELWILNAETMNEVIGRVKLPQRVPYGLHGNFFSEVQIASQRPSRPRRTISLHNNGVNTFLPTFLCLAMVCNIYVFSAMLGEASNLT